MKYLKYFEISTYHNLHGDDVADITQVKSDKYHTYERCDGVLYELSNNGNNEIVDINSVEHTDENTFYQDQIDRYVEYIENDGILQTFPVTEHSVCENLDDMLSYLDDNKNFDEYYELLKNEHEKIYNMKGLWDIQLDPENFGFNYSTNLEDIKTIEDLDKHYNEDIDEDNEDKQYDEELYLAFVDIIKYFDDKKTYTLTDFNHRFAALKELGKKRIYVEII